MIALQYMKEVQRLIQEVEANETPNILRAAEIVAHAVMADGIVHTFGTGHSSLIAEDVVYRAGGLAPVDFILEPSLTGHYDSVKSEQVERLEGFGHIIMEHRRIRPPDVLLIVSNSGRNAAPIEMAMEAKTRHVPVIAITSLAHSRGTTSRHSSGRKLYEIADVVIDNHAPLGDACIQLGGLPVPTGAVSSITGALILHSVMVQVIEDLLRSGTEPPVFRSGNLDGSDEYNRKLRDRYWGRIRTW